MVESKACAFVTYTQRSAAEKAAEELSGQLLVKGQRLRLMWGRPQEKPPAGQSDPMQPSTSGRPALIPHSVQTVMGAPPVQPPPNYFGLPVPQQQQPVYYPSMDPSAMGTRAADPGGAKRGAPGQDPGADPKRSRAGPPPPYGMPPPGMGYGYGGAPPGMGYGAPPPMHHHHMVPPPGGMPAAYPGMPPPRMPPPMATPHARPPPGAAPAAVPAAAASK